MSTTDTSIEIQMDDAYWECLLGPLTACSECGYEEREKCMTNGLCTPCYKKSPEAIQAAEEEEERQRLENIANATRTMAYLVSPEIAATDPEHPEFNREAWERFQNSFDGKLWPWFHSEASGQSKSRQRGSRRHRGPHPPRSRRLHPPKTGRANPESAMRLNRHPDCDGLASALNRDFLSRRIHLAHT
jgi:hypothetical protein